MKEQQDEWTYCRGVVSQMIWDRNEREKKKSVSPPFSEVIVCIFHEWPPFC